MSFFGFAFFVNTASDEFSPYMEDHTLTKGNPLQCVFIGSQIGRPVFFSAIDLTIVLPFILYGHADAIASLWVRPPHTATTVIGHRIVVMILRKKGLSKEDTDYSIRISLEKY